MILTPVDIQFNAVSGITPQESELEDAESAWLCVEPIEYTCSANFKTLSAVTKEKLLIQSYIHCRCFNII